MIRVLVAEDSPATREYLVWLLGKDPALRVVGTARDGLEAVAETERLKPNVILMDVHMPRMNGLEATRVIMQQIPTPIVMVSATLGRDEVAMTFEALQAGALTLVPKPAGLEHPDQAETTRQLLETIKLMAEVPVVRRWAHLGDQGMGVGGPRELTIPHLPSPIPRMDRKIRLVAIGASTGGPQTLVEVLNGLPGDLGCPILVVQHIAPGFLPGFVDWLCRRTPLTAKLAYPGDLVAPGTVYLAPDSFQMGVGRDGRIQLLREQAEGGFCPSASFLFASVAAHYGRQAVGILLTGMGRDGAVGLLRMREAGGVTIAQTQESCVVFGMPGEAIRLGAAEYVLSPGQIAELIRSLVGVQPGVGA